MTKYFYQPVQEGLPREVITYEVSQPNGSKESLNNRNITSMIHNPQERERKAYHSTLLRRNTVPVTSKRLKLTALQQEHQQEKSIFTIRLNSCGHLTRQLSRGGGLWSLGGLLFTLANSHEAKEAAQRREATHRTIIAQTLHKAGLNGKVARRKSLDIWSLQKAGLSFGGNPTLLITLRSPSPH